MTVLSATLQRQGVLAGRKVCWQKTRAQTGPLGLYRGSSPTGDGNPRLGIRPQRAKLRLCSKASELVFSEQLLYAAMLESLRDSPDRTFELLVLRRHVTTCLDHVRG